MFLSDPAGNHVVAHIGEDEGKMVEEAVHEALEGLSCVFQPYWHEEMYFEHSKRGLDG